MTTTGQEALDPAAPPEPTATAAPGPAPLVGVSHVRNVIASWGSFGVAVVAGLFVSPFVVHTLGTSAYGVWILVGSLTSSLNILDLGVRSAVTRFVAREHARSDHERAGRMASTARLLFLGAGTVAVLVSFLLSFGLEHWFTIPADLVGVARLTLVIAGVSLAVVLSNSLYGGILLGVQRLDLIGLSDTAIEVARIGLVVSVLALGGGLAGLALIGLLLGLLRHEYMRRASARLYPALRLRFARPRGSDVRAILDVSAFSTLLYVSGTIIAQVNTLVVGALLPVSMVTYYAIGGVLPQYARALNRPIAQTVHPRASRLESTGDAAGLREMICSTGRYSTLVVMPMAVTFITRGHTFIGIWMGEAFKALSGQVLLVLSLGLITSVARHVVQAAFVGSGRHRRLAVWYVLEAATAAALSVMFVSRWGIAGAPWAVVLPGMAVSMVVMPMLLWRHFGIHPTAVWGQVWMRSLVAMVPFAAASFAVDRWWPTGTYAGFFGQILLILPLAAVGALYVGLTAEERRTVLQPVARVLGRHSLRRRARVP
jgi:O-antigen/teichoic acid export membrane protein